jgi:demethylmenaquinone methyltransferase/2-methoxy-6-polyprenyl-1,4-benzoquinol methylase
VSTSLLDKRETRIRRMFNSIAPRYDLLNHLLSLNVDRYWRRRTTRLVPPDGGAPILDVCTGTGDLALAYDRAAAGRVPVVGADFCHEMLVRARHKAERAGAAGRVRFVEADAQRLPFPDNHFQIACVAFGLRNVTDTERGIAEMVRVTRPAVASPFWSSRGRAAGSSGGCTASTSAACCRWSAAWCLATATTLTATCRRASWSSPTARRWPSACAATG